MISIAILDINLRCPMKEKWGCFATTDGELTISDCIDIDTCSDSQKHEQGGR